MIALSARVERFETARPFVIARGTKTHVDVVVAEVRAGDCAGRGEATPIYYRGDDVEKAVAALHGAADAVAAGATRADLLRMLPAGAARNALDSALWDLEAKQSGRRAWELAGIAAPGPMVTAYTISLGDPADMEAQAKAASARALLKLKLGGAGDLERIAAVRRAAPAARLIADANEGWAGLDVERMLAEAAVFGLELVEQPLPAGADAELAHIRAAIPLAADESVQTSADLEAVAGRYQYVNLKLDKAGGLTEGLALIEKARAMGLELMTGCMLSTSLGIAPAFLAASLGRYADLDGPILLARDRPHGMRFQGSELFAPEVALWG